jgi:hypothetical protein
MIAVKEAITEKPHVTPHRIKWILCIIKCAVWSYHTIGEDHIVLSWLVIC